MPLLLTMQSFGIPTTPTVRANRLLTDANSGILMLRWYDKESVQLASTFCSPDVAGTIKHWDSKSKGVISSNRKTL